MIGKSLILVLIAKGYCSSDHVAVHARATSLLLAPRAVVNPNPPRSRLSHGVERFSAGRRRLTRRTPSAQRRPAKRPRVLTVLSLRGPAKTPRWVRAVSSAAAQTR